MKSITCTVRDNGQLTEYLDGLAMLGPLPTSIKEQMPMTAEILQSVAANLGRESVASQVRNGVAMRRAYDSRDVRALRQVLRASAGWLCACEAGFQMGVPAGHVAALLKRGSNGTS